MLIPVFRIFDYQKTIEFYVDWLDFQVDWEDRPSKAPIYMQVSKDDIVLHLSAHHGDCCPGAKALIEFKGLKDYHKMLLAKNYTYFKPGLGKDDWNACCMQVADPFGNQLYFYEKGSSDIK